MHRISVGVLAGGKRMSGGRNDVLRELHNRRNIKRLAGELACGEGIFFEMLISDTQNGRYEDLGQKVVYDAHGDIGPMGGLYQVIACAASDHVFVCAADMPFVDRKLMEYMAGYVTDEVDCYVLADEKRLHPLCAIYSKKVLPVVEALIAAGRYRLSEIFHHVRTLYIRLALTGFGKRVVRNLYVRIKNEVAEIFEVVWHLPLRRSGKSYLLVRVINEYI